MKKGYCFLCNGHKTYAYLAISKHFEKSGKICFFIVTNSFWNDVLISEGVEEDRILFYRKYVQKDVKSFDLKLKELVRNDRILSYEHSGYEYLQSYVSELDEFVKKNRIKYFTGEVTWAHEVATLRYCKSLSLKFIYPSRLRFPDNRVIFTLNDEFQASNMTFGEKAAGYRYPQLKAPSYIQRSILFSKRRWGPLGFVIKLRNFLYNPIYDSKDIMQLSTRLDRVKRVLPFFLNNFTFTFVKTSTISDIPKDKRVVLLTLHKQPESSIDVLGRYYNDQLKLIRDVYDILPSDVVFYIKPHALALSDHPIGFYNKIKTLGKNIFLLNPNTNVHEIITSENFICAITVSGTIALECSIIGKQCLTYNNVFFANENLSLLNYEVIRKSLSFAEILGTKMSTDSFLQVHQRLYENSRVIDISDPNFNSEVMSETNILSWFKALDELQN